MNSLLKSWLAGACRSGRNSKFCIFANRNREIGQIEAQTGPNAIYG